MAVLPDGHRVLIARGGLRLLSHRQAAELLGARCACLELLERWARGEAGEPGWAPAELEVLLLRDGWRRSRLRRLRDLRERRRRCA